MLYIFHGVRTLLAIAITNLLNLITYPYPSHSIYHPLVAQSSAPGLSLPLQKRSSPDS